MTRAATLTYFASPERVSAKEVSTLARAVERWETVRDFLYALPGPAIVLNGQRQIVAANRRFLEALRLTAADAVLGKRPGEALDCRRVADAPSGCGTARECQYCGFVNTLLEALAKHEIAEGECRLLTATGTAIDFEVAVTRHVLGRTELLFVGLRDVSAERRRDVLERTFFHDVLNTAHGLHGLLQLMVDGAASADLKSVRLALKSSRELIDEIRCQQQLLAAEQDQLTVEATSFSLDDLLRDAVGLYQNQPLASDKRILLDVATPIVMRSDRPLLSRVVGNLIKNALEATKPGGQIGVAARRADDDVVISVENDAVLDESICAQLFQRSFSTKGAGRGVGLYSVQLFTERYLRGSVKFTSSPESGTRFEIRAPRELAVDRQKTN